MGLQLSKAARLRSGFSSTRAAACQDAEESVNMNLSRDDHISFSACQLCVSSDGKYLLVSTDGPRILLLRISGWVHARTQIFGLPMDPFHTPVALWHDSGFYVMAAAAAGQIFVFHVGTGKVVARLKAHEKNVSVPEESRSAADKTLDKEIVDKFGKMVERKRINLNRFRSD